MAEDHAVRGDRRIKGGKVSKTAEWLREKYVDRMEDAFYDKHGRWPGIDEDAAIWEEAFRLAALDGLELG